jgi:hypothetical protein
MCGYATPLAYFTCSDLAFAACQRPSGSPACPRLRCASLDLSGTPTTPRPHIRVGVAPTRHEVRKGAGTHGAAEMASALPKLPHAEKMVQEGGCGSCRQLGGRHRRGPGGQLGPAHATVPCGDAAGACMILRSSRANQGGLPQAPSSVVSLPLTSMQ